MGSQGVFTKSSSLEKTWVKATTPEHIGAYFENLEKALALHMLQDRPRYNIDETGISPEHRLPNIKAPTKEKAHSVASSSSATTTVIAAANAAGACIPPTHPTCCNLLMSLSLGHLRGFITASVQAS
ncbi:hypothetical protein DPMN_043217 [Dreissena polymorpha]|uniref:Uncharacterized protein n=1 Tax=Dreissena polymorpha TaxID=45954 RepID=A0A9D4HVE3_DREPO|nr:hypothetical protein DPMN_043217 [Dreissena polymorpha]